MALSSLFPGLKIFGRPPNLCALWPLEQKLSILTAWLSVLLLFILKTSAPTVMCGLSGFCSKITAKMTHGCCLGSFPSSISSTTPLCVPSGFLAFLKTDSSEWMFGSLDPFLSQK